MGAGLGYPSFFRIEGRIPLLTLSALNGQEKGRVFQLTGEQPELMGRQAPNIKLTDAQTSRRHAEIILQNNTWLIRDLGSTNGTWVNGQRITQITELEVGDRLVVGRHQFRVSAINNLPAPTPQPKAPTPEPAIGHDDLAAIGAGVDLAEGLSADLLDDDGHDMAESPETSRSDSGIRPAPPAEKPAAKADTADDDALIDLDALLGDDKPDQSEESAVAQAPDDAFDLDAVLGLDGDADQPNEPPAESQAPPEPPAEVASAAVPLPADDTPPETSDTQDTSDDPHTTDAPDAIDDNVLDLDALIGGLAYDDDADAVAADDPADDSPEIAQTPDEPEPTQNDEDEPVELAHPDASPEKDDLIDIDILATARPASEWQDEREAQNDAPTGTEPRADEAEIDAELEADETPADDDIEDVDEVLGGLATSLDDEPETDSSTPDAFLVDGSDSGMGFDPDADDHASASHDTDASMEFDDEETGQADATDDDDDDALISTSAQVNEAEKGLLLTPQEQEQAVTGYRRSKMKSLVGVLLLLGAIGAAGWYGFNYYVSRANATSTRTTPPVERDTSPTPERPTDSATSPDHSTQSPTPQTQQGDTSSTPKPAPTLRQAPAEGEPLPPMSFPDPFADIAPGITQPEADVPETQEPAEASEPAPAESKPQVEPQPEPQPITPPKPDPQATRAPEPTPTPEAAPENTDQAPVEKPLTLAPPVETESPVVQNAPDTGSALGTIKEPETTQVTPVQEDTPVPKAEVDLITGAIDAQNKPGDRVTGQAEYAGARKVVYLVDASGSLVDSFPFVLSEMNRAVDELTGDKAFTVIFFGSDGVTEVPPVGLKWADTQTKRKVREWVAPDQGNVNAWGKGDLIQALQRALQYSPDDLVILTDNLTGRQSSQENIDELLARIEMLIDGKVDKVHVMQFFDRDPQQVLMTIAEKFHGTYSRVTNKPSPDAQSSADDPLGLP
ncbi:MAG: FHA domain-containing protein [Phycisphaerales bacterium]